MVSILSGVLTSSWGVKPALPLTVSPLCVSVYAPNFELLELDAAAHVLQRHSQGVAAIVRLGKWRGLREQSAVGEKSSVQRFCYRKDIFFIYDH